MFRRTIRTLNTLWFSSLKDHNADALAIIKSGPLLTTQSTAPISVPIPPNPQCGRGRHFHKELWLSVGGCDQIELFNVTSPTIIPINTRMTSTTFSDDDGFCVFPLSWLGLGV
jgi:hypothetical protein